jgi:hypothetical protein
MWLARDPFAWREKGILEKFPEGASNPTNPFSRGEIPGTERVLCLDEANGKIL